ncbi:DUF4330 domain-containing protein [bacterium]|nr:DUF4330 domain-containing protein [bacterium]
MNEFLDKLMIKKIRLVDVVILVAVLLALLVGFLTFMHFRSTASNQVESTSKIAFQVFLRGVTITGKENPIRRGDKTFVSIRNVPYTELNVLDVKADTKKIVMPNLVPGAKKPFVLVDDYSQAFMYDMVVTVVDTAKITKDGAVVGGNKIKIGLPITLEGKAYKFNGTVSNIVVLPPNAQIPQAGQQPQAQAQVQGQTPKTLAPASK